MIRDARVQDLHQLVSLIETFYDEAPYQNPEINKDQALFVLNEMLPQLGDKVYLRVAEVGGKVAGAIFAERQPDLWSNAEKVLEHFIYVLPEFRGKPVTGRLLIDFAKWSQIRPSVVRVEAGSGLDDEKVGKVFEKLGWTYRAKLYGMEAY